MEATTKNEKVLKLMLQNLTQEQIAQELNLQKYEVMNIQNELVEGGYLFGKTKSSILGIQRMEATAYDMALNWNHSEVDIAKNKQFNTLLFNLETSRI